MTVAIAVRSVLRLTSTPTDARQSVCLACLPPSLAGGQADGDDALVDETEPSRVKSGSLFRAALSASSHSLPRRTI